MIVADTNLIVALVLSTPATAIAEAVFKKDPKWTAPALWRYELRNVLATHIRVTGLSVDDAVAHFETAETVVLEPEIEAKPAAILRLAQAQKLSAYDAEFVALAHALKVKLVTIDGGILKAASDIAISPKAFAGV